MSNFAIEQIDAVTGQIKFYKLWIDDRCPFDDFIKDIKHEGNLKDHLFALLLIAGDVAQLKLLSQQQFKEITPGNERIREFEIKKASCVYTW